MPVIGLVQVGGQARADRYTYLDLFGVAVALTWLAGDLCSRRKGARRALAGAFVAVLAALALSPPRTPASGRTASRSSEYTVRVTEDNSSS